MGVFKHLSEGLIRSRRISFDQVLKVKREIDL